MGRSVALAALATLLTAQPGAAQSLPDSEALLSAIEEQKASEALDLIAKRGKAIVNTRGYSGHTPLTMAMRKRAGAYVNFLLQSGADPNLADRAGDPPLLIAARAGYFEGLTSILAARGTVDATNRQGETALIVAVQGRHVQLVRRLLELGADPARRDRVAGLSARDYAARDRRSADLLRLMDSMQAKPKAKLDFSGPIIK